MKKNICSGLLKCVEVRTVLYDTKGGRIEIMDTVSFVSADERNAGSVQLSMVVPHGMFQVGNEYTLGVKLYDGKEVN